jgi:hypothetical protein
MQLGQYIQEVSIEKCKIFIMTNKIFRKHILVLRIKVLIDTVELDTFPD